jgi:S-DNA-T family DNA segregation ATPase FtsK/SpoIIIE
MEPFNPRLNLTDYQSPDIGLFDPSLEPFFAAVKAQQDEMQLPFLFSADETEPVIKDLAELNNILVVGNALGKTTFIQQVLLSLLTVQHPAFLKLVISDFHNTEFRPYSLVERHFLAKLPGEAQTILQEVKKVVYTFNALCIELDNRNDLLKAAGCKNIKQYNAKFIERKLEPQRGHQFLPFIVVVIDEFANLVIGDKKEIEGPLQRLVSEGSKLGMFNIVSTNCYNRTDVLSKNFIAPFEHRLAFRFNDREDYRRYFETVSVDYLKAGEFAFREQGRVSIQGRTLQIHEDVIEKCCDAISMQRGFPNAFLLPEYVDENEEKDFDLSDRDPLFNDAAKLIVANQLGSTSLIQRRLKLGYNRAGRMMDQLEAAGVVGPNQGSRSREVLIKNETDLAEMLTGLDEGSSYSQKSFVGGDRALEIEDEELESIAYEKTVSEVNPFTGNATILADDTGPKHVVRSSSRSGCGGIMVAILLVTILFVGALIFTA